MASQVERQNNLLADCINSLKSWKELIDAHLEGEENAAESFELEEIVKEFCLIDLNASKTSEACQEVLDYFNDDTNDHNVDIEELYKEKLGPKQGNFSGDYRHENVWKQVFLGFSDLDVEEVTRNTQDEVATEYEEMNDSIFCSSVFAPPVDPISKKVIKRPYKSKSCGHVYEYGIILTYVKQMKNKAKCPYMGCGNRNLTVGDLVPDNVTKDKIKQYKREQPNSSQMEDSEEEE